MLNALAVPFDGNASIEERLAATNVVDTYGQRSPDPFAQRGCLIVNFDVRG